MSDPVKKLKDMGFTEDDYKNFTKGELWVFAPVAGSDTYQIVKRTVHQPDEVVRRFNSLDKAVKFLSVSDDRLDKAKKAYVRALINHAHTNGIEFDSDKELHEYADAHAYVALDES